MTALFLIVFVCALIPCGLFLWNLLLYRPLPHCQVSGVMPPVSVLIPARNEEGNIRDAVASALAFSGSSLEVLVLDDHSTDRTAAMVSELAVRDPRVRLLAAPVLPSGWNGKQHACHVLAQHARHPLLVFLDADVRLSADALPRIARFMQERNVALASGIPHQLTGSFLERLLLPLIHFLLLGFLPMRWMRRTSSPPFGAGCGQLFIAWAPAYRQAGGHAAIRLSLQDGLHLPRAFRRAGFRTDLFDATDVARCRMYHGDGETWRGLGKNATEGLGSPATIAPMTGLLLLGQVLPFAGLVGLPWLPPGARSLVLAACLLAWLPRGIAARVYHQSPLAAFLHPLGIVLLLTIQWQALYSRCRGKPSLWKGRQYPAMPTPLPEAAE